MAAGGEDVGQELEDLLACWFPEDLDSATEVGERAGVWFGGASAFDDRLRGRFSELPERVADRDPGSWSAEPRRGVAAVIAVDQIPRNLHRGSPRAFAYDARAVQIASALVDAGADASVHPVLAAFVYLPFEHAESRALQARSVAGFTRLCQRAPAALRPAFEQFLDYAKRHAAVVERFGRFPHRNDVLGRASTPEEVAYLEGGGELFA